MDEIWLASTNSCAALVGGGDHVGPGYLKTFLQDGCRSWDRATVDDTVETGGGNVTTDGRARAIDIAG